MTTQLAPLDPHITTPMVLGTLPSEPRSVSTQAMIFDVETVANMQRMAEMMASARVTIPKHLAGSPGDCLAIVMQAAQFQMNPFALAQKTHLINGVLGYEAQLVNAVISSSPLLASRIDYEWFGPWDKIIGKFTVKRNAEGKEYRTPAWSAADEDGCGITVWATLRGEQQPRKLNLLLAQARTRNSTLWADDPRQQLAYLAVKRWARLHAPDVMLGVYTVDELQDVGERAMGHAEVIPASPPATNRTDAVKAALAGRGRPKATPAEAAPAPDITLATVITLINDAGTEEELHGAGEMAKHLVADSDKTEARKAYSVKAKAMKAEMKARLEAEKAAQAEPPALELTPPSADEALYGSLCRALKSSATPDALAECEDLMRDLTLTEAQQREVDNLLAAAQQRIG